MKKFIFWLTIMILGIFLFTESIIMVFASANDMTLAFQIITVISLVMFVVGLIMSILEAYRTKKEKN